MKAPAILILALVVTGCARQPLPTYPWQGESAALRAITERGGAVQSLQSTASITLTAGERSVTLDGAILVQRPDRIRVRAWKLGQAVFDLTASEQGAWQYVPREEARGSMKPTREMVRRFVRLLMPDTSEPETPATIPVTPPAFSTTGSTFLATRRVDAGGGDSILETSTYDRATLTLQRFTVTDSAGHERFRLELSDYRLVGASVWPMTARAVSEQGVIEIRFHDVEINTELPPTAFKPPARAEPLP